MSKAVTTSNGLSHNDDALKLTSNIQCQKMLQKQGNNFPAAEKVVYSEKLVKINRKGKEQERVILITDKAIYNLLPNDFSKCKRRIDLASIESLTLSNTSNEFTIHIPDEYDYRYKSINKDNLCKCLSKVYNNNNNNGSDNDNNNINNNGTLHINKISQSSLQSVTITKDSTSLKTREERYKRYRELLEYDNGSDDDDNMNNIDNDNIPISAPINDPNNNNTPIKYVAPNDFEYLSVIGRGSFGKVVLVKYKTTKEILAMKILKKKAIIARNQVEHTKAERIILQQLSHPFLMRLRYAFQTSDKLYFVLNYYNGGELFFHLKKRKRFTELEAQIFVAEVALALGHLHSLGVIYRDLKPENILLDSSGHICLTDFGLSKQSTSSSTFCGTPEYLAPEIITNIGHNKAVDWWSLGILLYELSIGIPPYYSQNINEMYKKIQSAPLQFPPQSTPTCKSLISLLLERNPRYRLGSGYDDVNEIKRHPFFKNIDWKLLFEKKIKPIYKPNVKNDIDVSNFDKQFTNEDITTITNSNNNNNNSSSSIINNLNKDKDDDHFDEFSFVPTIDDDLDD